MSLQDKEVVGRGYLLMKENGRGRFYQDLGEYPGRITHFGIQVQVEYVGSNLIKATLAKVRRNHGILSVNNPSNEFVDIKDFKEGDKFDCSIIPGYSFLGLSSSGLIYHTSYCMYHIDRGFKLSTIDPSEDLK